MKNKHKVLLIDDDPEIVDVLANSLKKRGFSVEGIINGAETIKRVNAFKPDIIIMDIYLAGINGYEICKKLREDTNTSLLPIILISAHKQHKETVKKCGANGFINKPFDEEDLLYGISNLLPQKIA